MSAWYMYSFERESKGPFSLKKGKLCIVRLCTTTRKGYVFANNGRVALYISTELSIVGCCEAQFSIHVNHGSVSPTNGIGPTPGKKKNLTGVGIEPTTFG